MSQAGRNGRNGAQSYADNNDGVRSSLLQNQDGALPSRPRDSAFKKLLRQIGILPSVIGDKADIDYPHPREKYSDRWCPEERASVISRCLYMYVNSLVQLGVNTNLQAEDLWDLPHMLDANTKSNEFEECIDKTKKPTKPQGSVFGALLKAHGRQFFIAGCIKLVHDALMLVQPYILSLFLKELDHQSGGKYDGIKFALLMTTCAMTQTLLINRYFEILNRMTMHIKAELIAMLYNKALRLSSEAQQEVGTGSVVNYMSNDAQKLWMVPQYLHVIWSAPLQILVILAMLSQQLSIMSSVVAFSVTIMLIPISTVLGKILGGVRKKLVAKTEARVRIMTEVLAGIKAIKLYAWEEPYLKRINELRKDEQRAVRKFQLLDTMNGMFFQSGPIMVSLASFATYSLMGGQVTASKAFPAITLLSSLRFPIFMLPRQVMNIVTCRVALGRLQKFMELREVQKPYAILPSSSDTAIKIEDGTFSWADGDPPILSNVNISIKRGSLVMIVGRVGAGKSSLLAAMLGEMHTISGKVHTSDNVAYTTQEPWIQHMTLQSNVVMGGEVQYDLYEQVLDACELISDIEILPGGDQVEIGEKGINLSGGQKHRVALARACYSQAQVYLLDAPLSAVDAHVGKNLFNNCIQGMLRNSTRVMITHQMQYLPQADQIIVVDDGKILHAGSYSELAAKGVEFGEFEVDMPNESQAEEEEGKDGDVVDKKEATKVPTGKPMKKIESKGQLVKAEERQTGSVKLGLYAQFLSWWGPACIVPIMTLVLLLLEKGILQAQAWWLAVWSDATKIADEEGHTVSPVFYLIVFACMGFTAIIFQFFRNLLTIFGCLRAARKMHNQLLTKVMRLPMAFFDSQPTGRLVNRFTKDMEAADITLKDAFTGAMITLSSTFFSLLVNVLVAPFMLLFIAPLVLAYRRVRALFIETQRELKRLDSLGFSPIFSSFTEAISGVAVVRAFRKQTQFLSKNMTIINQSNRVGWPMQVLNRWLSVRLEVMSNLIVFFTAIIVSTLMKQSASLAGLAISVALSTTGLMTWMIRQITEAEVAMNAVERLLEYEDEIEESAAIIEHSRPPLNWPSAGHLVVDNLWVTYRPELDPVLKGISFNLEGGMRLGVCGRTGSGKSTLMMAVYRLVNPMAGSIRIDDIDITSIGLLDLRSRMSLVPQDPVLFSGSVRSNLDPFGVIGDDDAYWEALEHAGLKDTVRDMPGQLDSNIAEGGTNLSVGQKQLLCMARALLRKSRILILDEATSHVDMTTDALIQNTIRTCFTGSTVMTIAHRLNTIMDSDRILLLDNGQVSEFDAPQRLLQQAGGAFTSLVADMQASEQSG